MDLQKKSGDKGQRKNETKFCRIIWMDWRVRLLELKIRNIKLVYLVKVKFINVIHRVKMVKRLKEKCW